MQDRYSADIGDFGKFQFLRYLFNETPYSLAQLWYIYPDESHNSDGMYINYFDKVKGFDEDLENSFKNIIKTKRHVKALEDANLLFNIKYFGEVLTKDCDLEFRKTWFEKALYFSKDSQVVLCDADNGIATKCDRVNKKLQMLSYKDLEKKSKSGKYIFLDEIEALYEQNNTSIIYHHLNRCFAHDLQIKCLKEDLEKRFFKVIALKHKPYSPRVYFILCKKEEDFVYFKTKLEKFVLKFDSSFCLV